MGYDLSQKFLEKFLEAKVFRANLAEKKFEKKSMLEKGVTSSNVNKQLENKYRGRFVRKAIPKDIWGNTSSIPSREIHHLSDVKCAILLVTIRYRGDVEKIVDAINAIPLHLGAKLSTDTRTRCSLVPNKSIIWVSS